MKEYKKLSYETSIDKIKAKYQINKEQIDTADTRRREHIYIIYGSRRRASVIAIQ